MGLVTVGGVGTGLTVTVIEDLALSPHPYPEVELTQYVVVPVVAVLGVGAVRLGVPPLATVYHLSVSPALVPALNGLAVAPWQ